MPLIMTKHKSLEIHIDEFFVESSSCEKELGIKFYSKPYFC